MARPAGSPAQAPAHTYALGRHLNSMTGPVGTGRRWDQGPYGGKIRRMTTHNETSPVSIDEVIAGGPVLTDRRTW
ncbi:hypothetical protein [Actinoallomurus soli]|uniref:hypothetical protein n=1 Tax=Actinoallomurus soli TaxID=2952535 RepID=UPI00209279A6|nr:hypothetical protein [Actinoallomurus soli]MCO5973332.1 hypothetical protein [Actinoallomurus soli]